jgi:transposase
LKTQCFPVRILLFFTIDQSISKNTNARKDYLHKTSTTISKNCGVVGLEELKIWNMSKSANGGVENTHLKLVLNVTMFQMVTERVKVGLNVNVVQR